MISYEVVNNFKGLFLSLSLVKYQLRYLQFNLKRGVSMSALDHPDYKIESAQLKYILDYIKKYNQNFLQNKLKIDTALEYGFSHFDPDNREQYNEIMINTVLQQNLNQKLKDLIKSEKKPYFARVDFKENDSTKKQNLYIGKTSVLDNENNEPIVIDWRAPISNLYYEGRLGSAAYTCPEGVINGLIDLKRQYTIENRELSEIYDIDITTNDDFLQASLGSNKDSRLKDIVSTIQAEQNKVIRADMWKSLIVQGAAGGGKTTIALHRIAYLLYNFENTLTPQNFMIIAPNKFFLSYISEVLPELGVENVRQTTFEDFAFEIIGEKIKITEATEKISKFINFKTMEDKLKIHKIKEVSSFKSSLEFKNIVKDFISFIEKDFIPKIDFVIDEFTLLTYNEINELFNSNYKNLPMMKRINEIKKHLVNNLQNSKLDILRIIENRFDNIIDNIRVTMEDSDDRRKLIIKTAFERDNRIIKIKKEFRTVVKDYLSKVTILSPLEYYIALFKNTKLLEELFKIYSPNIDINFIRNYTLSMLQNNTVENEDLSQLMYIKFCTFGLDEKLDLRHIVIDEAQDFSLFQLFILKYITTSSFTILGDLCQGIHSYRGIKNWKDVTESIFHDDCSYLTLKQSYRTTIEIMNAANQVLKYLKDVNLPEAVPVIRHGDEVEICEITSINEIAIKIKENINLKKDLNYKSAAIICKTFDECKIFQNLLQNLNMSVNILTGNEKSYTGGIVIVPSYLVKGLEFDMVIIANASSSTFAVDELDIKLLYVAMTRALHKLFIYSLGKSAEMLKDI
jgi:DNA helicase II / ATP-dependent DNA helicase PcrA